MKDLTVRWPGRPEQKFVPLGDYEEVVAELERLRGRIDKLLASPRRCDDCPGGEDYKTEVERLREELAKHGRGKCMEYNAKYGGDVRIPLEEEA